MNLRNRGRFPIAMMRQVIAATIVVLFSLGSAHALPVAVPSEPRIIPVWSGPYLDGYSVAASGYANPVYLYFREKMGAAWGPWVELRMDQNPALNTPAFLASVNAGTVQLNEWGENGAKDGSGNFIVFAGDATTLKAHTAAFNWTSAFNIGFSGKSVNVDVELQFDWTHSAWKNDPTMQDNLENGWESSIEQWWNMPDAKVTAIDLNGGVLAGYPITFDVTLTGYSDGLPHNAGNFDQMIRVWDPYSTTDRPPFPRETMTDWFDTSGAQTVAHEFGHMLASFDEYWGGGINTNIYFTDYNNLMGASKPLSLGEGMKTLYYQPFKDWLAAEDPADSFGLILPEPPAWWILLLVSLAILRDVIKRPAEAILAH